MVRFWPNGSLEIPEVSAEFGGSHQLTGYHRGIDLIGYPINHAADDGVVIMASYNGTAGYEVRIKHDDSYTTRYLHNTPSLKVARGEKVLAKQALGVMGATGFVTGKHCHFEVITPDGVTRVNPREYISAGVPAGGGAIPFPKPDKKVGKKVTVYARRDEDGAVFAIPEGGPIHSYASLEEYRTARGLAIFMNEQNASLDNPIEKISVPPTEEDLIAKLTMDQGQISRLMGLQGAYNP